MLHIAICVGSAELSAELGAAVERELAAQRSEIECFHAAAELLRYIDGGGYAPELAFIEVRLNGESGIELAERINERLPACRILFLSDELSDAKEVYRAEHVWFMLTSELTQRLSAALHRALSGLSTAQGKGVLLRSRGRAVFLPLDEILYLERDCRRTLVMTERGEFCSSERPSRLLDGEIAESFVRSHRSYWVNRGKISAMERDEFVLAGGQRVPISRSWRATARDAFLNN